MKIGLVATPTRSRVEKDLGEPQERMAWTTGAVLRLLFLINDECLVFRWVDGSEAGINIEATDKICIHDLDEFILKE